MSNAAKVTVVIPNYNGLKFMEPCFKALEMQICRDFEILVVDNGSGDGSVEWLKEHEIPSIFLETNTGFSGAVNVGIRASKTPYVILLNNDTEPDCHYIGEMIKAIERSPKIFSVSSKMIQLYDHSKMDDAGDMYTLMGWAFQRGVGRPSGGYNHVCRVFSACAGAAIYRREVFETIGYFDEMHFAYLEDTPEKVARFNREVAIFIKKWPDIIKNGDPYYNPNLTLRKSNFALRDLLKEKIGEPYDLSVYDKFAPCLLYASPSPRD